jgi:hypothetical protein
VPSGFCAYHKSGSGIIYAVIPDFTQGGCAPGPSGCTNCCGDKAPFDSMTSVASHELMESVTDPMPTENPAWINALAGENGDLCQYAKYGHAVYTTVYARNGRSYTAQKGWSNAAFLTHFGTPATGCVDYPTTLCCNDAQTNCSWLANGSSNCPNPTGDFPSASANPNGIVVTAPTLGGFGNATATVTQQVATSPYALGITNLLDVTGGAVSPTINIATDTALVGASTACFALITDVQDLGLVQCIPLPVNITCGELKGTVQDTPTGPQCCIALEAQTSTDGKQLCGRFPVLGNTVIDVPALSPRNVVLTGGLLLGLGVLASRRRLLRV